MVRHIHHLDYGNGSRTSFLSLISLLNYFLSCVIHACRVDNILQELWALFSTNFQTRYKVGQDHKLKGRASSEFNHYFIT